MRNGRSLSTRCAGTLPAIEASGITAAAAGAGAALKLALNIGAMLLAFIALIALLNAPL
ncbi:nucleoside transporter C-terminal domain-containing protein, partial [Stenotrophomonas maltophilia]|uniref:nucleoside transporter C-terminal domain-containing protein n=1 Tax=Stenotrophomonas maltophilia TaxID=40324 RepID=UPI0039C28BF2